MLLRVMDNTVRCSVICRYADKQFMHDHMDLCVVDRCVGVKAHFCVCMCVVCAVQISRNNLINGSRTYQVGSV